MDHSSRKGIDSLRLVYYISPPSGDRKLKSGLQTVEKDVTTYYIDSMESIKIRVAVQILDTLPILVHFKEVRDKNEVIIRLEAETFQNIIYLFQKSEREGSKKTFIDFFNDTYAKKFSEITINSIPYYYWYFANKNINPENNEHLLLEFETSILGKTSISYEQFKRDYTSTIQLLYVKKWDILKREVERVTRYIKEYSTGAFSSSLQASDIEILDKKIRFSSVIQYDVFHLFDLMKISEDLPYTCINDFYKILKEFRIPYDWIYENIDPEEYGFQSMQDILVLKLNLWENREKYINVILSLQSTYDSLVSEIAKKHETEYRDTLDVINATINEKMAEREELKETKKIRRRRKPGDKEERNDNINDEKEKKIKQINEWIKGEEAKKRLLEEEYRKKNLLIDIDIHEHNINLNEHNIVAIFEIDNDFKEEEKMVKKLLNQFPEPNDLPIDQLETFQIKADFVIPVPHNKMFYQPLFLDMIVNSDICSSLFFVDESKNTKVDKWGVRVYTKHNPYSPSSDKVNIGCIITNGIITESSKYKNRHPLLKEGVEYIRININKGAKTLVDVANTKILYSNLIGMYFDRLSGFIEKYEGIYPPIRKIINQEYLLKTENMQKYSKNMRASSKELPEFAQVTDYKRFCQRHPIFIALDDKNAKEKLKKIKDEYRQKYSDDIEEMIFPKNPGEGRQYYFICPYKKDKYPGLKKNTLDNRDEYFGLPCCYGMIHENENHLINRYYNEETSINKFKEIEMRSLQNKMYVISTNKMLIQDQYGYPIVKDISSFLMSCCASYKYYRKGTNRSVNSAIEVLCDALSGERDIHDEVIVKIHRKNFKDELAALQGWRKKLAEFLREGNIAIYQQTYLYTNEGLTDYLADPDKYFDPKMFIHLLEKFFKCKIFIFQQDDAHENGNLASPLFLKEYFEFPFTEQKCVLMYEHYGLSADNAKYPQCELIALLDAKYTIGTKSIHQYTDKFFKHFGTNTILYAKIKKYFELLYFSPVNYQKNVLPFRSSAVYQNIDYYGKTRGIVLSYNTHLAGDLVEDFSTLSVDNTHPKASSVGVLIAPMYNLPNTKLLTNAYLNSNIETLYKFLKFEDIPPNKYECVIYDTWLVGIKVTKKDFPFYMPIEGIPWRKFDEYFQGKGVRNINYSHEYINVPISFKQDSYLEIYVQMKRIARYLCEYIVYLFSIFYKSHGSISLSSLKSGSLSSLQENIQMKTFDQFSEQFVRVKKGFVYDQSKITRLFSFTSPFFEDGKLIVPSDNVLYKLIYVLRLRLRENKNLALHYSEYKYIQNYYLDIKDYTIPTNANFNILNGKESLFKWIESHKPNYTIYNSITNFQKKNLYDTIMSLKSASRAEKYLYCVLFLSKSSTESKRIEVLIYNKGNIPKSLSTIFRNDVKFIYVDLDRTDTGIKIFYNVFSAPVLIFFTLDKAGHKLTEIKRIIDFKNRVKVKAEIFDTVEKFAMEEIDKEVEKTGAKGAKEKKETKRKEWKKMEEVLKTIEEDVKEEEAPMADNVAIEDVDWSVDDFTKGLESALFSQPVIEEDEPFEDY